MGSLIIRNILRFVMCILLQGLVFVGLTINMPVLNNTNIIIYPIAILLLPLRTPTSLIMIFAFIMGMALDFFYNTPGMHASASVLTAFLRPYVLSWIEPRGGYTVESSPTLHEYGRSWFFRYAAISMAIHLFFLFSVQVFTFVYFSEILIKTILSWIASMVFIMFYILIFNPRE